MIQVVAILAMVGIGAYGLARPDKMFAKLPTDRRRSVAGVLLAIGMLMIVLLVLQVLLFGDRYR